MWLDHPTDVQDNGEALQYLEKHSLRVTVKHKVSMECREGSSVENAVLAQAGQENLLTLCLYLLCPVFLQINGTLFECNKNLSVKIFYLRVKLSRQGSKIKTEFKRQS